MELRGGRGRGVNRSVRTRQTGLRASLPFSSRPHPPAHRRSQSDPGVSAKERPKKGQVMCNNTTSSERLHICTSFNMNIQYLI